MLPESPTVPLVVSACFALIVGLFCPQGAPAALVFFFLHSVSLALWNRSELAAVTHFLVAIVMVVFVATCVLFYGPDGGLAAISGPVAYLTVGACTFFGVLVYWLDPLWPVASWLARRRR